MISLSTAYFPNTLYFSLLASGETIEMEHHESFQKQSFRNRTSILNIDKKLDLVIPIQKGHKTDLITHTKIDSKAKWRHQHWGSIKSAYGRAPFFEYYAEEIKSVINGHQEKLFDLNRETIDVMAGLIGIQPVFTKTTDFEPIKGYLDFRNSINPKHDFPSQTILSYNRHFGNDFAGSLSILDLLFNEGPQSLPLLKRQAEIILNELN